MCNCIYDMKKGWKKRDMNMYSHPLKFCQGEYIYLSLPESRGRREKGKFPSYFQNARFVE